MWQCSILLIHNWRSASGRASIKSFCCFLSVRLVWVLLSCAFRAAQGWKWKEEGTRCLLTEKWKDLDSKPREMDSSFTSHLCTSAWRNEDRRTLCYTQPWARMVKKHVRQEQNYWFKTWLFLWGHFLKSVYFIVVSWWLHNVTYHLSRSVSSFFIMSLHHILYTTS